MEDRREMTDMAPKDSTNAFTPLRLYAFTPLRLYAFTELSPIRNLTLTLRHFLASSIHINVAGS